MSANLHFGFGSLTQKKEILPWVFKLETTHVKQHSYWIKTSRVHFGLCKCLIIQQKYIGSTIISFPNIWTTCSDTQSNGRIMPTMTATWFCTTSNMVTLQTGVMLQPCTTWIPASSVSSLSLKGSAWSNTLSLAFMTSHEPDLSCSSAFSTLRTLSSLQQSLFL